MRFIEQQTESPVALDLKEKVLPLPEPGVNEHRLYFNHREEEREESEDGEVKSVKVPVADYVAAANATVPTYGEWEICLTAAGYDSEQIGKILAGD